MAKFFWALVIIASIIGGIVFVVGYTIAKSAPQQAAAAAAGVALVVIPYCMARAVDEISQNKKGESKEDNNSTICKKCGVEMRRVTMGDTRRGLECPSCKRFFPQ